MSRNGRWHRLPGDGGRPRQESRRAHSPWWVTPWRDAADWHRGRRRARRRPRTWHHPSRPEARQCDGGDRWCREGARLRAGEVGPRRRCAIGPFGLHASGRALDEAGQRMGTLAYMAPEQASGEAVDARADIFSFGAMLYKMATGQRAFSGKTPAETLSAVMESQPTPPSHARAIPAARSRADDPPLSSQGSGETLSDDGGRAGGFGGDQGGVGFEPCGSGTDCAATTAPGRRRGRKRARRCGGRSLVFLASATS